MGFWAGFAQGYTAEKDRIEARKQYQDALDLKKKDMVLQIAQRRAELGMTSSKSGGSANAYAASLAQMQVDPDKIAKLASEGGPEALKAVNEAIRSAYDPKNPWTPEQLNAFVDSTVVAVTGGGSVDVNEIAASAGVTLDPTEQDYFSAMTTSPASTTVLTPLPKPAGAGLDDKKNAISMATSQLGTSLDDRLYTLQTEMATSQDPALAQEYADLQKAKDALDKGAPGLAIAKVGGATLGNIIKDQPALQGTTFGGGWDEALSGSTQAPVETTPTTAPAYIETGQSYSTKEEVQAAIAAGKIPKNGTFLLNGTLMVNN